MLHVDVNPALTCAVMSHSLPYRLPLGAASFVGHAKVADALCAVDRLDRTSAHFTIEGVLGVVILAGRQIQPVGGVDDRREFRLGVVAGRMQMLMGAVRHVGSAS